MTQTTKITLKAPKAAIREHRRQLFTLAVITAALATLALLFSQYAHSSTLARLTGFVTLFPALLTFMQLHKVASFPPLNATQTLRLEYKPHTLQLSSEGHYNWQKSLKIPENCQAHPKYQLPQFENSEQETDPHYLLGITLECPDKTEFHPLLQPKDLIVLPTNEQIQPFIHALQTYLNTPTKRTPSAEQPKAPQPQIPQTPSSNLLDQLPIQRLNYPPNATHFTLQGEPIDFDEIQTYRYWTTKHYNQGFYQGNSYHLELMLKDGRKRHFTLYDTHTTQDTIESLNAWQRLTQALDAHFQQQIEQQLEQLTPITLPLTTSDQPHAPALIRFTPIAGGQLRLEILPDGKTAHTVQQIWHHHDPETGLHWHFLDQNGQRLYHLYGIPDNTEQLYELVDQSQLPRSILKSNPALNFWLRRLGLPLIQTPIPQLLKRFWFGVLFPLALIQFWLDKGHYDAVQDRWTPDYPTLYALFGVLHHPPYRDILEMILVITLGWLALIALSFIPVLLSALFPHKSQSNNHK